MEFELDIELCRQFGAVFIKESNGRMEKVTTSLDSGSLANISKCIAEGAGRFGLDASGLLKRTQSVRLKAPEIVQDTLANKSGARIGLIVTRGHEEKAYFAGKGGNPVFDSIDLREMVVGVEEQIDSHGGQITQPSQEEVRDKVRRLLEFGAEIIAVCLARAALNNVHERLIKQLIESDYPRHYLGAVPVLISTDFSIEKDDFLRTNICLFNAYIWFNVERFLRGAGNVLRQGGYGQSLSVIQADGDVIKLSRLTPLKCHASDQIGFIQSLYS